MLICGIIDGDAAIRRSVEALARAGRLVAVADVRGFGEDISAEMFVHSGPYYHSRGGMDADCTYASFLLGRPMLGLRVADALAVLHALGRGRTWRGIRW